MAHCLTHCEPVQERIRSRCRHNLDAIRRSMANTSATVLEAEGGWTALVRLPAIRDDEAWALHFLREGGCLVQPGYYFNMESTGPSPHIALSLLTATEELEEALVVLTGLV